MKRLFLMFLMCLFIIGCSDEVVNERVVKNKCETYLKQENKDIKISKVKVELMSELPDMKIFEYTCKAKYTLKDGTVKDENLKYTVMYFSKTKNFVINKAKEK